MCHTDSEARLTRHLECCVDYVQLRRYPSQMWNYLHRVKVIGHELVGSSDEDRVSVVIVEEHIGPVEILKEHVNCCRMTDELGRHVLVNACQKLTTFLFTALKSAKIDNILSLRHFKASVWLHFDNDEARKQDTVRVQI